MKKTTLLSILSSALLLVFLVIWFGLFNVSAKEKHWKITTAFLEFVRERSIEVRADGIEVPDLSNLDMISNGAKNYAAMCAQCHLSPTMKPTELSLGLYPQPPVFYTQEHFSHGKENTFWTIKNGLKLTGMPAWGDFHTDEQIWELVAFLNEINGMSTTEYLELTGSDEQIDKENSDQHH
ncbi:MAG: cytochrome c [Xanthomonadales bacterium]|nr:cytochrome c [Xanthomonadales bacterium]